MGYCYYEHPIHVTWTLAGGWYGVWASASQYSLSAQKVEQKFLDFVDTKVRA